MISRSLVAAFAPPALALALVAACGQSYAEAPLAPENESGANDAAAASDAMSTADQDAEASGVGCAMLGKHDFCADFDDGPLGQGWADVVGTGLSLDSLAKSPPRSLLLSVGAGDGGARTTPYLGYSLSKSGSLAVVKFDLQRETANPTVPLTVLGLTLVSPGSQLMLSLSLRDTQGSVSVLSAGMYKEFLLMIGSLATFRRIELRVELVSKAITVKVDGALIGMLDLSMFAPAPAFDTLQMKLGLLGEGTPSQAWKARFDDVTLDVGK